MISIFFLRFKTTCHQWRKSYRSKSWLSTLGSAKLSCLSSSLSISWTLSWSQLTRVTRCSLPTWAIQVYPIPIPASAIMAIIIRCLRSTFRSQRKTFSTTCSPKTICSYPTWTIQCPCRFASLASTRHLQMDYQTIYSTCPLGSALWLLSQCTQCLIVTQIQPSLSLVMRPQLEERVLLVYRLPSVSPL